MSDAEKDKDGAGENPADKPKKGLPFKGALLTAAGAVALGGVAAGAAFIAAPGADACHAQQPGARPKAAAARDIKDVAFVTIQPMIISLGPEAKSKYLKISVTLETSKTHEKSLNAMTPRLRDVLNSYLRAVDESDLERPAGMTRIRAQMLRRLQLVAPEDSVSDILITDFVLT